MLNDLQYTIRVLLRKPLFTAVAVLTLALAIGANTAIFSVVNSVLLRPLPLPDPDRLMTLWHSAPAKGLSEVNLNDALFTYYRDRSRTFEKLAAYEGASFVLTGAGDPEALTAANVTFNYFDVLGREPLHGRTFLPQEDTPDNNHVAILSYGLWQRRFAGDVSIIGQSIKLDNVPTRVVGVMPAGFDFPDPAERPGNNDHVELWVPKGLNPQDTNSWNLSVIGRLKPGATSTDAQREIAGLWEDFAREYSARIGGGDLGSGVLTIVISLQRRIVGEVRTPLLVLLVAVALVLLIACANLANLLLARAASRNRELAVRQCLGASGLRIARQFLLESLLLALVGALAGLLLATWGIAGLKAFARSQITHLESVRIDGKVLLFTIAVTLLTGAICGLAPALRGARVKLQEAVKEGARGSTSGTTRRWNNAFVVSQLALSLVLLIGAALLLQSFRNLLAVDPGFKPTNVLMASVSLPDNQYSSKPQIKSFYDRLLHSARNLPGVQAAELCNVVPFSGGGGGAAFIVEGHEPGPGESAKVSWIRSSSPGYFAAMGMPILKGRSFQTSDTETSQQVAIIDEKLMRMYWTAGDPIGKRIQIGRPTWLTIVGVVPSVKNRKLSEDAWPYIYRPDGQWIRSQQSLVVRTSNDPTAVISLLRKQVAALDPSIPLDQVTTIEQAMARSLVTTKLTNLILASFAVTALLLAIVGTYGVMSLNVSSRTNEFGIRLALGAQTSNVLRMVLGQGLRLALIGLTVGLIAAFGLTRLMTTLLFGIDATDALTFVVIGAALIGATLLACYIPARRATKVDPLEALRYE